MCGLLSMGLSAGRSRKTSLYLDLPGKVKELKKIRVEKGAARVWPLEAVVWCGGESAGGWGGGK